jgi:uncharacterized cupin superfamily protein
LTERGAPNKEIDGGAKRDPFVMTPNLFEPQFDAENDVPGFRWRRARLGRQAGAERLGASLFELVPGEATFPYHAHTANEELLIVVAGHPHLRTPDGWRQLERGDVVAFPRGEAGAHQVVNRSDRTARVLIISEMNAPEVNLYPDTGRVGAMQRAPGSPGEGGVWFFRPDEAGDYWEGEEPPGR